MNLLEAIQNCGDNWFRPVDYKNPGQAFSVAGNYIYYHYGSDFCEHAHIPTISEIKGEWEIVTPEQVISERK